MTKKQIANIARGMAGNDTDAKQSVEKMLAKPKKVNLWWIEERHNPQTGVYYVACGQLSKTAAQTKESTLYGENIMHSFATEAEYRAKMAELLKNGERFV